MAELSGAALMNSKLVNAPSARKIGELWSLTERNLFSLLQQRNTKSSLLQIHAFMLRNALEQNINLFTKFVTNFSSSDSSGFGSDPLAGIRHARKVFDARGERDKKDTFLCNSMIKAYVGLRQFDDAIRLYKDLRKETEFSSDCFTFTSLAKSCGLGMDVREGEQVHEVVVRVGLCSDLCVSTALVDMYAKFGRMGSAQKVFDEMTLRSEVSWTALIWGYARCGDMGNARTLFGLMPGKDVEAYNAMIDAHVKDGDVEAARGLFDEMAERNVVTWTSMVYGYCKNGDVGSGRLMFDEMPVKNLFSWNTMIGGYCQNREPQKALELFRELQMNGVLEPDAVTIVSVLPAIADMGAMELGDWVYLYVKRKKLDKAVNVCTALVDMYAKCGEIVKARAIFNGIFQKEVVTWNAMINGFAINGCGKEALELFDEMICRGYKPNEVTMIGVLSACSHCGLVSEGNKWLKAMGIDFNLIPGIEHYGCMIDLLGKAGRLDEAEEFLDTMPYKANKISLSSFLNACVSAKDVLRAERVTEKVIEMEPTNDGNYITLRNLYATERRWKDAGEVQQLMHTNGAKKEAGCSVIEVDHMVSAFVAGDRFHPQWNTINLILRQLHLQMKKGLNTQSQSQSQLMVDIEQTL